MSGHPPASASHRAASTGRFLDRAAAVTQSAAWARGRHQRGAEHSAGPQLLDVGKADSGELSKKVGLGGADAVRVLRASTKGAAGRHSIIVRAAVSRSRRGAWSNATAALLVIKPSFWQNRSVSDRRGPAAVTVFVCQLLLMAIFCAPSPVGP